MITFGRPVVDSFEKQGVALQVMRVPFEDDGVLIGYHEVWFDLNAADEVVVGTVTKMDRATKERFPTLGFRPTMRSKRSK